MGNQKVKETMPPSLLHRDHTTEMKLMSSVLIPIPTAVLSTTTLEERKKRKKTTDEDLARPSSNH